LLSRRGRLVLAAAALLLMSALIVAPSVSGARQAVKQFTATISPPDATGGVAGSWTVTVTNCGGTGVPDPRCTLASTIGLGSIRIAVPTEFRPIASVSASSPNWTVSYDSATGNINANVTAGSNKLQPGQSVQITLSATPEICASGTKTFTTSAWGSTTVSGTDPFVIQSPQPTVTVATAGSCLESGGSVTDPTTGQTETLSGDFQGHVNVTFDGDLIDCGFDPQFGNQWSQFHLRAQVNITPAADFVAGSGPKISTSTFTPVVEGDSSFYLICWAAPTTFATRGGGTATEQNGLFVGILPNCYNPTTGGTRPEPCVSEQFKDITTNKIVISVRTPPGDPHKR
jgi:hypothetical protein